MTGRDNDSEQAIVRAFLRSGHPRLAFGTVIIRSMVKLSIFALIAGAAIATGRDGSDWIAQILPTLLR